VTIITKLICKTPTCDYVNMFVSQVVLSGITLEPHVDQLVTRTLALADSNMKMQLCRHCLHLRLDVDDQVGGDHDEQIVDI
jgi:hypothetical protein